MLFKKFNIVLRVVWSLRVPNRGSVLFTFVVHHVVRAQTSPEAGNPTRDATHFVVSVLRPFFKNVAVLRRHQHVTL